MSAPYSRPQDVIFSAEAGHHIDGPYTDEFPTGGTARMRPKRNLSATLAEVVFYALLAGTTLWAGWLLANLILGRTP